MIVSIDKKSEKFAADCFSEISKLDDSRIKAMCFVILTTDDIITIEDNCQTMDLAIMATNLQMKANFGFTTEHMQFYEIQLADDDDCEDDE